MNEKKRYTTGDFVVDLLFGLATGGLWLVYKILGWILEH